MTTSLEESCPACGTLNTLVIRTAGLMPGWRIGCSSCGATVIKERQRVAAPAPEFVQPVASVGDVALPSAQGTGTPASSRPDRHSRPPDRAVGLSTRPGASSGAGLLAVCGLAFAFLIAGQESMRHDTSDFEPGAGDAMGMFEAKFEARNIPRYRVAAEVMLGDEEEAYPDPREGMMRLQLAALADPEADAEREAELGLSMATRREIQQRLHLAGHDPRGVDGVFGPATRAAIAVWQQQENIPPTGYVTERTLDRLVAETEEAYDAWRMVEEERRAREQRLAAAEPPPRPVSPDTCARLASGEIDYGQNLRCDVRGLGENLGTVGGMLVRLFDGSERSRAIMLHRRPGPGGARDTGHRHRRP